MCSESREMSTDQKNLNQAGDECFSILGLCNPLLDISATVDLDTLSKYKLEPNGVILAGDEHKDLCSDLVQAFKVDYTAGGSAQNAMRVAAGLLKKQNVNSRIMFTGAVGNDEFGRLMSVKAKEDGVDVNYMIDPDTPTGTCAVLLTEDGKNRSLCAFLGACQKFSPKHLETYWKSLVEDTDIFYITGFLIAVSLEAFIMLGKFANENNKLFCLNLSAPYVSEVFGEQLLKVIPYTDIIFGNETEVDAFARLKKWENCSREEVVAKIAQEPKHSNTKRIVICTQGEKSVIASYTPSGTDEVQTTSFNPNPISKELIVDTNGAGDAFVGGFLSQYVQNPKIENLKRCIEFGNYAAGEIIKRSGVVVPSFDDIPD